MKRITRDILNRTLRFAAIHGIILCVFTIILGGQFALLSLFLLLSMSLAHFTGAMNAVEILLYDHNLKDKIKEDSND